MGRAEFRHGNGVSDPSLIWALGDFQPNTPDEEAAVRRAIDAAFTGEDLNDRRAVSELSSILFDDPIERELVAA